jgi:hypothetical protein
MLFDDYVVEVLVDGFLHQPKQTSDRQTEVRQASTRPVGDAPGLPEVAHHFFDGPSTNDPMPVTPFTRRWPEAGWRGVEKATEVLG